MFINRLCYNFDSYVRGDRMRQTAAQYVRQGKSIMHLRKVIFYHNIQ